MQLGSKKIKTLIDEKLNLLFAIDSKNATKEHIYKALCLALKDELLKKKQKNNAKIRAEKRKRVYYLCMEFLIGRNLKNTLSNLGLEGEVSASVKSLGFNLDEIYELETDPALGNGGLGRLAACFMDSLATLNYPATGYSLLYEYGLFKQKLVDNVQVELPDTWLDTGEVWLQPRIHKSFEVKLGGYLNEYFKDGKLVVEHHDATIISASPYDIMIAGAASEGVSTLRLWKAQSKGFDMRSFSHGDYLSSLSGAVEADTIGKVLYPADDHFAGKQLRISQQYFLVSASLQDIIKDHLTHYGDIKTFSRMVSIHLNDTHPALAIPELMRLLMDEHGLEWDEAFSITSSVCAYTNHTVLSEALEKWDKNLIEGRLPRIYSIIKELDRRFVGQTQKPELSIIDSHGQIRMANLCIIGSKKINGVSKLHSDIIKKDIFKDFYNIWPHKFTNVTNGIAHRRWLNQANPRLAEFITELIGPSFYKDASQLAKLDFFSSDNSALERLYKIKSDNKIDFASFIKETEGISINPHSRIDAQIKRFHEYKRQLLNVLKIISEYALLLENPNKEVTPQTFIFGGKAAAGYFHAKRVISLISSLSSEIAKNKKISDKLSVVLIENYNVSKAERIFPASEVSQQISLAGKEASGTGNMKFMINGAVTLGTIDGANVEIASLVGKENIFTFGLRAEQVEDVWRQGYFASEYYTKNKALKTVIDMLRVGFNGNKFDDIANYLLLGHNSVADPFMCLADFYDYIRASKELDKTYKNKLKWQQIALKNISSAGFFASDRSTIDYAKNIWEL